MLCNVTGQKGPPVGYHQEGLSPIVCFTRALISRVQGVAGGAAAVVSLATFAPLGVGADLTTNARRTALISVYTCLGVIQTLTPGAGAQGSTWSLHTAIAASSFVTATVIKIAVRTFISAIRTVGLTIADTGHGDADTRGSGVWTLPCAGFTSQLCCMTRMCLALITTVTAVILTITDERSEHALVVVTLEVVAGAAHCAAGVGFITPILTVWSAITIPQLGHTDAALLTLELRLSVTLIRSQDRTSLLITTIVTIGNTVTLVALMNALLQIAALELTARAGYRRAALLVSVVKAVIVAITSPRLGNAGAAVTAGELELIGMIYSINAIYNIYLKVLACLHTTTLTLVT